MEFYRCLVESNDGKIAFVQNFGHGLNMLVKH